MVKELCTRRMFHNAETFKCKVRKHFTKVQTFLSIRAISCKNLCRWSLLYKIKHFVFVLDFLLLWYVHLISVSAVFCTLIFSYCKFIYVIYKYVLSFNTVLYHISVYLLKLMYILVCIKQEYLIQQFHCLKHIAFVLDCWVSEWECG